MSDLISIHLQEGSEFSLALGPDGNAVVELPRAAVERALLLAGTSYPTLVRRANPDVDADEIAEPLVADWSPERPRG